MDIQIILGYLLTDYLSMTTKMILGKRGFNMPRDRGALTAAFIDKILYAVDSEGKNKIMNINEPIIQTPMNA